LESLKAVKLELTISEARIICNTIASYIPKKEDEMISIMLYARIKRKIEEVTGKNESL
jgi:hypothetical protein